MGTVKDLIIIIKVFVKHKILSTETALSMRAHTHTHKHTHKHAHTHTHTHGHPHTQGFGRKTKKPQVANTFSKDQPPDVISIFCCLLLQCPPAEHSDLRVTWYTGNRTLTKCIPLGERTMCDRFLLPCHTGQPHAIFGGSTFISGGWMLLCKELSTAVIVAT